PCFFIRADDETPFLVKAQRLEIELTDILGLGLKVGIVAVEPVHAPMGLEVGLLQDAPEARATDGLPPMVREGCNHVVQTPPGGGTMRGGRLPGCHREHLDALNGGKRAAGVPSAGHPASRGSPASDTAAATGQLYDAHTPSRWRLADWTVGRRRR